MVWIYLQLNNSPPPLVFVGNVGGYMGIFLGASLLTLTGLLEVFMVAVFLISKRLIRKVKGNVISSEKIARFPEVKTS